MKNCTSCGKELPDTAMHCVFCGGKQLAPAAPAGGGEQAKTIMGYAAADLLKNINQQQGGQPQSGGNTPAPSPMGPPPSGPPPAASGGAPNPMGPPPSGPPNPMGPPPGSAPHPMGPPPGGAPNPMGPPPGGSSVGSNAKTMMADQLGAPPPGVGGSPGPMGPPPGAGATPMGPPPGGAPNPMGPPPGSAPHPMGPPPGGAPNPMGPPPGGAPNPMGPPPGAPMQPMPHQGTEQVKPLAPPPYLASQTAARMDAPQEPWEGTLRMVMIVFGLVLVAAFAAPWELGGEKTIFAWTSLGDLDTFTKVQRIMIAGTGVLSILLGLLPLASLGRGIAAALIGLAPIIYGIAGATKFQPMSLILALGMLSLVAGLIVRSQYKSSVAARIMVTIGALAVIAVYLIPQEAFGDKGLLMVLFDGVSDADGKDKARILIRLLPFFLAVASLIAWIPAPSSAGAIVIAWIWIVLALASSVALLLIAGDIGDRIKGGLGIAIWEPGARMAWVALVGYGIATVVGKQLEHA